MRNKKKVVGTGFSCIDIIQEDSSDYILPGGTCANVVTHLSRLGWETSLLKAQYNDNYNNLLDDSLNSFGVQIFNFAQTKKFTPRTIQRKSNLSIQEYTKCPSCKRTLTNIILPSVKQVERFEYLLEKATLLYFDRISSGIKKLINISVKENIWTMYEPNSVRMYKTFKDNAYNANILKFSAERIPISIADKIINELDIIESKLKLVIVTKAKDGLVFSIRSKNGFCDWVEVPVHEVTNILDTTGAGDRLSAEFIKAFFEKEIDLKDYLDVEMLKEMLYTSQIKVKDSLLHFGAQGEYQTSKFIINDTKNNQCEFCKVFY